MSSLPEGPDTVFHDPYREKAYMCLDAIESAYAEPESENAASPRGIRFQQKSENPRDGFAVTIANRLSLGCDLSDPTIKSTLGMWLSYLMQSRQPTNPVTATEFWGPLGYGCWNNARWTTKWFCEFVSRQVHYTLYRVANKHSTWKALQAEPETDVDKVSSEIIRSCGAYNIEPLLLQLTATRVTGSVKGNPLSFSFGAMPWNKWIDSPGKEDAWDTMYDDMSRAYVSAVRLYLTLGRIGGSGKDHVDAPKDS